MAANIVLVSRFPIGPNAGQLAPSLMDDASTRYLFDLEKQELLQLRAYESPADFAAGMGLLTSDLERFANFMNADVKRELLNYVEAPKSCSSPLPDTDYVQLRHIEVPPNRHAAYRTWREETIFQVVRDNAEVEVFLAYHSLVSTQPGVMFISGFSCLVKDYSAVFESNKYREIIRQADEQYVAGSLYTRIYQRASLFVE